MKTLLQINTSLFGEHGSSTQLADRFVSAWRAAHPGGIVTVRDLSHTPVPHLTAARLKAFLAKPEERTPEEHKAAALSEALIGELKCADVIAMGLPMYNFGVPSTLKAYFDHIARAGITFRYTENGPEGLLKGKRAYVFATRGGLYVGTPLDTQTNYVRDFLNFLGIAEVEFVYAEGLALGDASQEHALAEARGTIDALRPTQSLAAGA